MTCGRTVNDVGVPEAMPATLLWESYGEWAGRFRARPIADVKFL